MISENKKRLLEMIKVIGGIATREPIPPFLVGLAPSSLSDLSWTDPQLGVQDCAWWPEIDVSAPLGKFQKYSSESFEIDNENKIVKVTREIVEMPDDEKEAIKSQLLQQIDAEVQRKIRERYTLEDEQYFARIGVGVALGMYEFQNNEREELIQFGNYVESVRQWAREQRALIGL